MRYIITLKIKMLNILILYSAASSECAQEGQDMGKAQRIRVLLRLTEVCDVHHK